MSTSMVGGGGLRGPTAAGQRLAGPYQNQKLGGGFKQGQMNNFSPDQMQLFQSLFSHVSPDSQTSRLAMGDQSMFNDIEAPQMRQFNQQIGNLASRFTGLGGQGSLSSRRGSGFQNALGQQSSNFSQDLQSQRQQLQRQALMDLMGMSNSLMNQKPYENFLIEPKQKSSFLQQLIGGLSGGLGQIGGNIGSFGLMKNIFGGE